jgi:hypothetical protein
VASLSARGASCSESFPTVHLISAALARSRAEEQGGCRPGRWREAAGDLMGGDQRSAARRADARALPVHGLPAVAWRLRSSSNAVLGAGWTSSSSGRRAWRPARNSAARGVRGRLPAAPPAAGRERPGGRRLAAGADVLHWVRTTCRCRSRGASSGPGPLIGRSSHSPDSPGRRPPNPAWTTSAPAAVDHADQAGPPRDRPGPATTTSRGSIRPAVVRDRRHQPGPAGMTCWPPGPPGGRGPRHHRGGRSRRRDPGFASRLRERG